MIHPSHKTSADEPVPTVRSVDSFTIHVHKFQRVTRPLPFPASWRTPSPVDDVWQCVTCGEPGYPVYEEEA